jgi:hypothetical protein
MHESLIKYINSYATTPLTDGEVELIKDTFVPKKIRKGQYLLQEGQVSKYAAFIVKGANNLVIEQFGILKSLLTLFSLSE